MALAGSLCLAVRAVTGFTNKSHRGQVAGLLGRDYSSSQMRYDLRRLRLHGLIERQPGTNSYTLTPTASALLPSTPSSMPASSTRSSRRTTPRHLSSFVAPSQRSNESSATRLRMRESERRLETCHKSQRLVDREELGARRLGE
jgi:hypothetical protein